jgi:DNA polymerase-3 subunit alpha
MAMLTVEDAEGKCDAVVFPDTYEEYSQHLADDAIVFLRGTLDRKRERPSILVNEVIPIDRAVEELTGKLVLRLHGSTLDQLDRLCAALSSHRGQCPILLEMTPVRRPDLRAWLAPDRQWYVSPSAALLRDLEEILADQAAYRLYPRPTHGNGDGKRKRFRNGRKPGSNGQSGAKAGPASEAVTRFN